MNRRLDLQHRLERINGVAKVYFQPPTTIRLEYPCIIYKLEGENVRHADDLKYHRLNRYTVTVFDKDPESMVADQLREWRYCSFDRTYASDNLNHFVFTLYF